MTQGDPLWVQGNVTPRTYSAREDRQLLTALWTEGVISGLSVTPGGAMNVTIGIGSAIIQGDDQADQGSYMAMCTAAETIAIAAAPGANSRIDLVYYRINDPNAGGPAGENSAFGVVQGVAAASPAVPALPATAIPLAQVLVASGTVTITAAMITSVRQAARLLHGNPTGTLLPFAGLEASVPSGYLLCNGQAVSRDTYFGLFGVIGTTYGAGNGTTTFNVPDMRGRVPVGLDNMGGVDAGVLSFSNDLGAAVGAQTHALTIAEMPTHTHVQDAHTHTQNAHTHIQDAHNHLQNVHNHLQDPHVHGLLNHSHAIGGGAGKYAGTDPDPGGPTAGYAGVAGSGYYLFLQDTTDVATGLYTDPPLVATNQATTATNLPSTATNQNATATNNPATATNQNTGGGGSHNNMQPSRFVNYIIKT